MDAEHGPEPPIPHNFRGCHSLIPCEQHSLTLCSDPTFLPVNLSPSFLIFYLFPLFNMLTFVNPWDQFQGARSRALCFTIKKKKVLPSISNSHHSLISFIHSSILQTFTDSLHIAGHWPMTESSWIESQFYRGAKKPHLIRRNTSDTKEYE